MILTGKAKEEFFKWYYDNYISVEKFLKDFDVEQLYSTLHESFKLSLIIDWFDVVGFYININPNLGGGQVVFYPSFIYADEKYRENERNVLFDNGELYYSTIRQEAIIEVIKKATEIYNLKNKTNSLEENGYSFETGV